MKPKEIKDSLRYCWNEGIPAAIMIYICDYYLSPLGLFLGASSTIIGSIVAVPHLIASFTQIYSVGMVRFFGNRKRLLVWGVVFQSLICFGFGVTALKRYYDWAIPCLILLIISLRVFGNFIGTAWGSLVSEYLDPEERGDYLGRRSQMAGAAGLLGMAIAGIILYVAKKYGLPHWGFFMVFALAGACRLVSSYLMAKMIDLPLTKKPGSDFTFYMFIRQIKRSNFVKFVLFVAGITFAVQIASPYYAVFMIRDKGFSYLSYMLVYFSHVLGALIGFPIWGRNADVAGNARILKTTSFLIALLPIAWQFYHHPLYLMAVEFCSGFIWSGFNLCAVNFIYDAVVPEKRLRCLGYFNLINGTALFLGVMMGGLIADHLPAFRGFSLLTLFWISAGIRFLAHFFLSPNFKEVRVSAWHVKSTELFWSVIGIKPLVGRSEE